MSQTLLGGLITTTCEPEFLAQQPPRGHRRCGWRLTNCSSVGSSSCCSSW